MMSDTILGDGLNNTDIEESQSEEQREEQSEEQNASHNDEQIEQQVKSWRDDLLPDDIKGEPLFEKYQSPQEAFKAFVEAQKLIGKKGIIPPEGEDEGLRKEFLKEVYEKIGEELPEDPADYEIPEVEDIPDELKAMNEEDVEAFKDIAHKAGLTKRQAEEIYKLYIEQEKKRYNEFVRAGDELQQQAEDRLREKWGKAYDVKVRKIQTLVSKLGSNELIEKVRSNPYIGNDPDMVEFLGKVVDLMSEDVIGGEPRRATMTPEEAKSEIYKIKMDNSHPFNDQGHPEHKIAKERMNELYKLAYPELTGETR